MAVNVEPRQVWEICKIHQSKLSPERVRGSLPGFRARMKLNASLAITVNLQGRRRDGRGSAATQARGMRGRADVVPDIEHFQLEQPANGSHWKGVAR